MTGTGSGSLLLSWRVPFAWWSRLAHRHPFIAFYLVIIWPNALWSVANLVYNDKLIVESYCTVEQKDVFWHLAVPLYSSVPWVLGMVFSTWLMWPLFTFFRALKGKTEMARPLREAAERRLVNLPWYQLWCNFLLWMPGGFFFPLVICTVGGWNNWPWIAIQFLASFAVSALVTTFQTFVLLDRFLLVYFYPGVFTDARPAKVTGSIHLPFQLRLWFLWGAVSLGPMIVLVLITANLLPANTFTLGLLPLTVGVVIFSIATGVIILWVVGNDMGSWLETHVAATREIAKENFGVRIAELRSDEWGRLTDSFNDMAQNLTQGRQVHETFGQFVGPEVRDEILKRYGQLGGNVQEITVMFADIRGFTRRSSGKAPEEVVELLNRFLSLGVKAVEDMGGWVNKFLGDGFMALFGTPLPRDDHADVAVAAACDLLSRLDGLNSELEAQKQPPLHVGIGIHTGPALVGCIGATISLPDGRQRMRLEFTAIGETVNLTQRVEELTKVCGTPLLLSEATRVRLRRQVPITCVGPQEVRGAERPLVVYRLKSEPEP
jgi:adenylate cyclase